MAGAELAAEVLATRKANLLQLIKATAAGKGMPEDRLIVLDDQKLETLVKNDWIAPESLRDTPASELTQAGLSPGAAKILKRLFPDPTAGA